MTKVIFRASNLGSYAQSIQSSLPCSRLADGEVTITSPLDSTHTVNDHIVWIYGVLKHQKRLLKTSVSNGARLLCECFVTKGEISISPNAAEFLHLFQIELVLKVK